MQRQSYNKKIKLEFRDDFSWWFFSNWIGPQFAAVKKARAAAASMGVGSGAGSSQANVTDEEVRQISEMAATMDVEEDEIDSIVEAVQLEEYERNVELAQD